MLTVQVVSQSDKWDYSKRHAWIFSRKICCENWKAYSQYPFSVPEIARLPSVSNRKKRKVQVETRKFVFEK